MKQYIYGKNAVNEALRKKRVINLYVNNNSKEYERYKVSTKILNNKEMTKLVNTSNHQGIVAEVTAYKTYSLDDMLKKASESKYPLIVALDGLKDPHNLGAILRTCDCVLADGVIYKKHQSVSLNSTVAKVSCGAIETVMASEVVNLPSTLDKLKKAGYWIVGSDVEKAVSYPQIDYKMPTVLVIGSEGEGISRLVKEKCDFLIKLPMLGSITSLNASVATGVILYEILNQRNKS